MKTQTKILLILFFFIAVGICAGAFYEVTLQHTEKKVLGEIIFQLFDSSAQGNEANCVITFSTSLCASLKSFLPVIVCGACSPVILPLLPVLPIFVIYKGFTTGFCTTLIIETLGSKGILCGAKFILFPAVLQLGAICYLCVLSISYGRKFISLFFSQRKNKISHRIKPFSSDIKHYLICYLLGTLVLIISFIVQALLLPLGL